MHSCNKFIVNSNCIAAIVNGQTSQHREPQASFGGRVWSSRLLRLNGRFPLEHMSLNQCVGQLVAVCRGNVATRVSAVKARPLQVTLCENNDRRHLHKNIGEVNAEDPASTSPIDSELFNILSGFV